MDCDLRIIWQRCLKDACAFKCYDTEIFSHNSQGRATIRRTPANKTECDAAQHAAAACPGRAIKVTCPPTGSCKGPKAAPDRDSRQSCARQAQRDCDLRIIWQDCLKDACKFRCYDTAIFGHDAQGRATVKRTPANAAESDVVRMAAKACPGKAIRVNCP